VIELTKKIEAVVFDWTGTTVDYDRQASINNISFSVE
jgi:hypothetical protein